MRLVFPGPFILMVSSILTLSTSTSSREDLFLGQVLDRAYQQEMAFHEYLKDYICGVTSIVCEPQKDGTAKTLSIVEKTICRKLPDKRVERYHAIIKDGQKLSPQEVAERQKNQQAITLGRGRCFFGPQECAD